MKLNIMNEKQFYVYITASLNNRVLYIGVTSDLKGRRVWQHKTKAVEGFTRTYNVDRLVYFEVYCNAEAAITREKAMKKWNRQWKINLIEEQNPEWKDLYEEICA